MKLARFLAEVRIRTLTEVPDELDPAGLPVARITANPSSNESCALCGAMLAIIKSEGDVTEADLGALDEEALSLLDVFAVGRRTLRYRTSDLQNLADKLRELRATLPSQRATH